MKEHKEIKMITFDDVKTVYENLAVACCGYSQVSDNMLLKAIKGHINNGQMKWREEDPAKLYELASQVVEAHWNEQHDFAGDKSILTGDDHV